MQVPILETERLRLRGHTRADFEASAAMWAEPEVERYIRAKPSTREESWARLIRYHGLWPMLDFGYWLVEDKQTGRFLGEVGFGDFLREIEPSFNGAPEQGWVIAPWAQGKGLAREAVAATLVWADTNLRGDFVCMIAPENTPSLRVAARAGYREFARTNYKDGQTVLLRRPRPISS